MRQKKLSAKARRKESTGIQNNARKKEIDPLKKQVKSLKADFEDLEKLYSVLCIDVCQIYKYLNSKGK